MCLFVNKHMSHVFVCKQTHDNKHVTHVFVCKQTHDNKHMTHVFVCKQTLVSLWRHVSFGVLFVLKCSFLFVVGICSLTVYK